MAAEGRKKSSRSPSRERIRSMERERRSPERPLMRDHGRDPYMERRDPYADPYGPPRPTRPADRPPFEVQIFMHSPQQRGYAEAIDARLRRMDMMTDILVVIEQELSKLLMDTTRRGVPYAIVLTPQNEMHRSLTLNILYGTPQEHRNMPLEDAMSLVSRNFQIFLRERQERLAKVTAAPPAPPPVAHVAHVAHVTPPVPPTGAPPEFVLPDKHTRYLLNLIADDRILSVEEIDKLLDYLEDRRFRYIQVHGGPTRISKRYPLNQQPAGSAANSTASVAEKVIDQQQQQLQDRILSILNGGDVSSAVASVVNTVKQPEPLPSTPSMGINFDNPSVQKALNDLLQTGPLLTNLGASSMASTMPSTSQAYQQSISSQGYHQTANVHPQYVSRNQFNPY